MESYTAGSNTLQVYLHPPQEVFGAPGRCPQEMDVLFFFILGDEEVPVLRVIRENPVHTAKPNHST
jgi:hypothetical protein